MGPCFNCGQSGCSITACTKPKNHERIKQNLNKWKKSHRINENSTTVNASEYINRFRYEQELMEMLSAERMIKENQGGDDEEESTMNDDDNIPYSHLQRNVDQHTEEPETVFTKHQIIQNNANRECTQWNSARRVYVRRIQKRIHATNVFNHACRNPSKKFDDNRGIVTKNNNTRHAERLQVRKRVTVKNAKHRYRTSKLGQTRKVQTEKISKWDNMRQSKI